MTSARSDTPTAVESLRSPTAIRERATFLLERARSGQSRWFVVDDASMAGAADEVAQITLDRYPDLSIPYHSRWRHFEAGGVDRKADLVRRIPDIAARARAMIDLTVVSVLLDAGAGPTWHYVESTTAQRFTRSEGLGVASWQAFLSGTFSSDPTRPLQVDAAGLRALSTHTLSEAFQAGPGNELIGLDGRTRLLHRLGDALATQPDVFGPDGRPGGLFDVLSSAPTVSATKILAQLLATMSGIWLANNMIDGNPVGDCWYHPAVPGAGATRGWVPFHKLSQWMTYSLLEPFEWADVRVTDLDALTGLPEYRNGGLLLDTGVLRLRDPALATRTWSVGDELVVEWRALTVALLDELAPLIRARLGAGELPLACLLEGGTWATGRRLAQQLRGGLPPLSISSDGTVF